MATIGGPTTRVTFQSTQHLRRRLARERNWRRHELSAFDSDRHWHGVVAARARWASLWAGRPDGVPEYRPVERLHARISRRMVHDSDRQHDHPGQCAGWPGGVADPGPVP